MIELHSCEFCDTEMVDLSITADNQILELHIDGRQVSVEGGEWTRVRKLSVSSRIRTIAVKCLDQGVSSMVKFAVCTVTVLLVAVVCF